MNEHDISGLPTSDQSEKLSMTSPASVAIATLVERHIQLTEVAQYLEENGGDKDDAEARYRDILQVIESEEFQLEFGDQWQYQTSGVWKDRTAEKALQQTTFNGLSNVIVEIDLMRYNQPVKLTAQKLQLLLNARFLIDYLRSQPL